MEEIDVTPYAKAYYESMPNLEGFETQSMNPIIKDEKIKDHYKVNTIEKDKMLNLVVSETVNEEISTPALVPNYLRPIPEVDPELEDSIVKDAIWVFPGLLPEPYWDYTLNNNTSRVKKLMKKSLNGALKQSNIELITETLKSDPEAVLHYGIHPKSLSDLIIHNKELAMDFLNAMSPYTIITDYYDDLAQTRVNLNSIELFNKIVQYHELPNEYILIYINNCFETCNEDNNENIKNRLVRLVCIVVGFLLKFKVIPNEDLVKIKAEEFFRNYPNVKETAQILKQIKNSEK